MTAPSNKSARRTQLAPPEEPSQCEIIAAASGSAAAGAAKRRIKLKAMCSASLVRARHHHTPKSTATTDRVRANCYAAYDITVHTYTQRVEPP